ncbi:hypothetical protein E8E13_002114 [Curvularia kusanoi]|uniref:Uncharacterized protein n=1 Tax=Curvularia kusanoi TaxID=90978 RepID=A0A9P4T424_CURKU|nr:hypothetical protein E8E13_002114 [Curvularia kusanoi]
MDETKLYVILGAVLGTLVLTGVCVAVLFCWMRNKRRVRGFSIRAVTPLDDSVFESWRRPSEHAQRNEKYGIRPVHPAVTRHQMSPSLFEKELDLYDHPRSPSPDDIQPPLDSPRDSIRKPERARRKSSVVSSVADRPPTPYSPTSTTGDFVVGSWGSHKSQPLIRHQPSMSEASAFRFEFESSHEAHQKKPEHWV